MKFFPLYGDAQVGKQDAEDTVNFPKLIKRGRQGRGERERELTSRRRVTQGQTVRLLSPKSLAITTIVSPKITGAISLSSYNYFLVGPELIQL